MSIIIGDRNVNPGEKIRSTIKIGEASTHEIEMPYIVINGELKGKILCVIGGIHPLEYASIIGVQRIAEEIMPNQLMGQLILIPVVNTEGFNARSAFNNQIDYVNQNRVFPGDPDGTMSRRVANILFEEFVSKADALIDCHGGDLTEDIVRYVIIGNTADNQLKEQMLDMASCFDSFFTNISDIQGSTGEALKKYGIPCITPESGTPYPVRESDIKFHYEGIINVMKYMNMLKGEPTQKKDLPINPIREKIFSNHGGLWLQKIDSGKKVYKNQELGSVVNLFGELLQKVEAPFNGIVNSTRTSAVVNTGDVLLSVFNI